MLIKEKNQSKKELIFYLSIAYIFGVFVRLLVFNNIVGIDEYWFEGRPIPIWSDDAGLYGYYAKEIMKGVDFAFSGDYILAYIIAYTSIITTIHIDWIMFVLPAFLSSLVVIPIIMMGYILNKTQFSFFVAMIGVIGINYYTRSYLGYMDTDGINMFLIYSLVTSIIVVIYKKDLRFSIISIISLLFLLGFYHSSKSLIGGVLVGYLVVGIIFYFKEKIIYQLFILLSLAFIMGIKFGILISLVVSFILLLLFIKGNHNANKLRIFNIIFWWVSPILRQKINGRVGETHHYIEGNHKGLPLQVYISLIFISILGVLFFVDLSSIYSRILDYANINNIVTIGEFQITNVLSTVSETQQRGIFSIYDNFIGIKYYVVISTIGYFLLVYKHREFIFFLPLLILGYLSFKIGIRFTMYSSFVLAFGFVYILYYFKENIIYIGIASAIFLMFFNILRINSYIKPKYFLNEDLKLLNELKLKKDDSLISWWDYGWPLWYYMGQKNTYIDNGNNTKGGTVFVSKMLLSPPKEAYDLAKIISTKTKDLSILKSQESIDAKVNNIKNKDTYIMLHQNMLNILMTLSQFSDRDILTGDIKQKRIFISSYLKDKNQEYIITNKFRIDIKKGLILDSYGNIAKLYGVINLKDKKIINSKKYYDDSKFIIVISDKRVFYMDIKTFNSFLIQAILLNKINTQLFKDVSNSSKIKILKLR